MSSREDQEHQQLPRTRSVPPVVLGLAAVAVLGPLFLLRRLYTRTARVEHVQLNSVGAAPPIRRAGTLVSASAGSAPLPGLNPLASTSASPLPSITASDPLLKPAVDWTNFGHTGEEEEDYGVPPPPPPTDAELDVDNSLDALKAIGIATAAVSLGAAGLFFGVKHWMGVSTIGEFAYRMRVALGTEMPELKESMDGSVKGSLGFPDAGSNNPGPGSSWEWAAAQQRLAKAYEEGGAARWGEQLQAEAEAEARVELARRTAVVQQHQHADKSK